MDDCIFCKIVKKEIPCAKIYEDEKIFVFFGYRTGIGWAFTYHPQEHIIWMQDADNETIGGIFKLSKN